MRLKKIKRKKYGCIHYHARLPDGRLSELELTAAERKFTMMIIIIGLLLLAVILTCFLYSDTENYIICYFTAFNTYFFNAFVGISMFRYFKACIFLKIANSVTGMPNGRLQIPQHKDMTFAFFTFSFKHSLQPISMFVWRNVKINILKTVFMVNAFIPFLLLHSGQKQSNNCSA